MENEQKKLRTRREIEVFARKKALVFSVIFMTVTCVFSIFLLYSSFGSNDLRLSITGLFILIYASILYIRNRHTIEKEENYKNEVLFEQIYLSKEEKKQVMPLEYRDINKEWKAKGAKFYALLTKSDNIYIYAKVGKEESEIACIAKGFFRKYYKLV